MTILDSAIAWALPHLQAEAESRMRDTIRFTRPSGGPPVWDEDAQDYIEPGETVYEGKCRIRWANPAPQDANAGETAWAVDRTLTVSLPVSDPTSAAVTDGHTGVVLTTGPGSAVPVRMVVVALMGHWQTDTTARRIPCQVVSRDA